MVHRKPIASFSVILCLLVSASVAVAAPGAAPVSAAKNVKPAAPNFISVYKTVELGIVSWPETVSITDGSGSYQGIAQFYSFSLGYANRTYRPNDGIFWEAYLLWGKADIGSTESTLTYFQKRAAMYGFGANYGWFYRPESKKVNIGVSAVVQNRHATWTEPTGVTVGNKDLFSLGATLEMRWRLTEKLAFNNRIGQLSGQKSAIWMLNLDWSL